jgi:hypothetical protein
VAEQWWPEPQANVGFTASVAEITRLGNRVLTAERERDDARAEAEQLRRVVGALKSMLAMANPCIHEQMVAASKALDDGSPLSMDVDEYMASRGL